MIIKLWVITLNCSRDAAPRGLTRAACQQGNHRMAYPQRRTSPHQSNMPAVLRWPLGRCCTLLTRYSGWVQHISLQPQVLELVPLGFALSLVYRRIVSKSLLSAQSDTAKSHNYLAPVVHTATTRSSATRPPVWGLSNCFTCRRSSQVDLFLRHPLGTVFLEALGGTCGEGRLQREDPAAKQLGKFLVLRYIVSRAR